MAPLRASFATGFISASMPSAASSVDVGTRSGTEPFRSPDLPDDRTVADFVRSELALRRLDNPDLSLAALEADAINRLEGVSLDETGEGLARLCEMGAIGQKDALLLLLRHRRECARS